MDLCVGSSLRFTMLFGEEMLYFTFLLLSSLQTSFAVNGKCRILALGGGSDKGAYTAGGVIGLISALQGDEAKWDVVTGNGDGALNAYILSQVPLGEESTAAINLDAFWSNFSLPDFYSDWLGWFIRGLFYESGLYDSSNMKKTIEKLGTRPFSRTLAVGATDLLSGSYTVFNSSTVSAVTMKTGVFASMSKAGIFPYVQYKDLKLVDGSIKYAVDLFSGINICSELGYSESAIIIDSVISDSAHFEVVDPKKYVALQFVMRYLSIKRYNNVFLVYYLAQLAHPEISIRHKLFPSATIPDSLSPYDFSRSALFAMLNLGIKDGKAAVSLS